ncbi:MAG: DNA alkylation repair protein [Brooklawnia sp.]|uniref:DNA alkylation repair protein n=1 Tax=Brooklawnia sp. TaxID=2699740 RepID=UPI003C74714B
MGRQDDLVATIRAELAAAANPERAVQQQAYVKSTMPCHGIPNPRVRMIVRTAASRRPTLTRDEWIAAIRSLWTGATHREECLAAIELADARRTWTGGDLLDLYELMARTGAWWDLVDPLASHLVGDVLRAEPEQASRIRAWANADDPWLRRVAILSQLRFGAATDTALLAEVIEANFFESQFGTNFFVRKAIGWALREYARVDAAWVRRFVAEHAEQLSTLSRREALRHLG